MEFNRYQSILERAGVIFHPGLSDEEVHQIEDHFRLTEPVKPIPFWSSLVDANNGVEDKKK